MKSFLLLGLVFITSNQVYALDQVCTRTCLNIADYQSNCATADIGTYTVHCNCVTGVCDACPGGFAVTLPKRNSVQQAPRENAQFQNKGGISNLSSPVKATCSHSK